MDRLFLDANILFSAAYRPDAGLVQLWKLKDAILCSSHYALEEARINLTENMQRRRLAKLARRIYLFDAAPRELPSGLSLPEKDVPILLAAMEAKATHLITGDVRHFGPYFGKQIEGIFVLSPADCLKKRREH
ncbi:MAG: DNA-binding protein [Verrucomicrobia bacterium]|nr:MAG: DNA-binding protein [Verrucomicrobiota bacterium]